MIPADVLEVSRDAIWIVLKIASPILMIALMVGLAIAFFQALTQIQEMTLTFVPKILAIFVSLGVLLPFMGQVLSGFMDRIADRIINMS